MFEIGHYAVIGLPDPEWGERVVLATTQHDCLLEKVRELILQTLPNYCVPKEIYVVDSIPQTTLGKVRRSEIRALLSADN